MSAGNHAQAVARHAGRLGIRATIVMPIYTPTVKVEQTRRFGAEVVLHGDDLAAAGRMRCARATLVLCTYDDPA
jgi:threonine dehydratase